MKGKILGPDMSFRRHGNRLCSGRADADFPPHIFFSHLAGQLKHVKSAPGAIKTEEGRAVKELPEASWEDPVRGGSKLELTLWC